MLYYLLVEVLRRYFSPLNVFRYITVRTVYASLTAMFLALVFGPWLIRHLRELQIGQFSDVPHVGIGDFHNRKSFRFRVSSFKCTAMKLET